MFLSLSGLMQWLLFNHAGLVKIQEGNKSCFVLVLLLSPVESTVFHCPLERRTCDYAAPPRSTAGALSSSIWSLLISTDFLSHSPASLPCPVKPCRLPSVPLSTSPILITFPPLGTIAVRHGAQHRGALPDRTHFPTHGFFSSPGSCVLETLSLTLVRIELLLVFFMYVPSYICPPFALKDCTRLVIRLEV